MAKVNDEEALESIIEHKQTLGGVNHSAIYIQKYIHKPGRDIRAVVFGGELKAAIYRNSSHWITNTARGGRAENCELTDDLKKFCKKVSKAFATKNISDGGILGIDIFEDENEGFLVNEINHTMEFKNSEAKTGVDISGEILKYCRKCASKR